MSIYKKDLWKKEDGCSPFEIKPTIVENKQGNNNMVDMMLDSSTTLSELSCFHLRCAAIQDIKNIFWIGFTWDM